MSSLLLLLFKDTELGLSLVVALHDLETVVEGSQLLVVVPQFDIDRAATGREGGPQLVFTTLVILDHVGAL